tara:strand:+ start:1353 stop:1673 length:321 start_codon:yes stop_codon:yes gene_type:complete
MEEEYKDHLETFKNQYLKNIELIDDEVDYIKEEQDFSWKLEAESHTYLDKYAKDNNLDLNRISGFSSTTLKDSLSALSLLTLQEINKDFSKESSEKKVKKFSDGNS